MVRYTLDITIDDTHITDEVQARNRSEALSKFLMRHLTELEGYAEPYILEHIREVTDG